MSPPVPLLLTVLLAPERATTLTPAQWDLLIRQARRALLLARLAVVLQPVMHQLPSGPRHHLEAAILTVKRQAKLMRWEVEQIRQVLEPLGVPVILLKGAAYLLADLPASHGRVFGDVDILVPKVRMDVIEAALLAHGWSFEEQLDAYDERYYRDWMHEIPPLTHEQRGSSLDVHHTILPPTARLQVNTAALFDDLRPVRDVAAVQVLGSTTMVLHSATHLFHEGELDKGLRDLLDLDSLLRGFGQDPAFWPSLTQRAAELGLQQPLMMALRYTSRLLGTPVPQDVLRAHDAIRPRPLLDFSYDRALMPLHASCARPLTPLARQAVYLRSHWLKMPTGLLVRHLVRKTWKRWTESAQPPEVA
ncbi:MAG: hypothetical protein DI603_15565 [Roseateles depolymerans]|uniref:Nucleotidyltransferase family protein n=1 Tax=Roseateles depolymerans TaxID=76731 RepID=A0A2W5DDY0_9BURK|nr:MAG: hypothetical protein DI603_15565 [Roseateles depolymerans]